MTTEPETPHPSHTPPLAELPAPAFDIILSHAIFIGITPLIPIPFLDDWLSAHLSQRRARKLYEQHGLTAPTFPKVEPPSILKKGLGKILGLPARLLKKLFRKAFFLLHIKGLVGNLAKEIYVGYLIDYALSKYGTRHDWATIEAAASRTCDAEKVGTLNMAIRGALQAAKKGGGVLVDQIVQLAQVLVKWVRGKISEQDLEEVTNTVEKSAFFRDLKKAVLDVHDESLDSIVCAFDKTLEARQG